MGTPTSMQASLEAGLGFLAETYAFTVRAYDEKDASGKDYSEGPTAHGLSWQRRILWLQEKEEGHCEWLHEVAHIVCSPPWEHGPKDASEFSGIFAWERAVGREFRRKGLWTKKDWADLHHSQSYYGVGIPPKAWSDNPSEWGSIKRGHQNLCLAYMYQTLRLANLLDKNNRPTWAKPVWSEGVKHRWQVIRDWNLEEVIRRR